MPIKLLFILSFLLFFIINVAAQKNCYNDLRARGMQLQKEKNYRRAIDKYFAARYCPDKPAKEDLDELIKTTQDQWVNELDQALERSNKLLNNLYYGNKALGSNDNAKDFLLYNILSEGLKNITDENVRLEWRLQMAGIYARLKAYDAAIILLDSILQEKPDYLQARQSRAVAYYYADRIEDCISDCDYLIEKQSFLFIAHLNKAHCLARLGKYAEASAAMKAGQQYFLQGDAASQYYDGDLSPEIEEATGLQTLFVDESGMRDKIEYVLLSYRVYQGEAAALREMSKRTPSQFSNTYLGTINFIWFHLKGRPQDYGAHVFAALLWERAGYTQQAIESLQKFQILHKQYNDRRYQAFVAFANEKLRQLQALSTEKVTLSPKVRAVGLSIKANQAILFSKYQEALDLYKKAATLDPNNLSYRLGILEMYNNLRDCDNILREATAILQTWKNCTQALYYKALCNFNNNQNINQLAEALQAILQIDAYHTPTLELLGNLYGEADPAFAVQMLERYLQMYPSNQEVQEKLAALRNKN
ncbi:MAG: hypothetical protein ACK4TA_26195 [Saprospiraceae bacterium]